MYGFTDIIKNRFLEEFAEITISSIAITILVGFLLGCFIVLIYRLTYSGVLFNRNFAMCLPMLSTVTALAVLIVSSNVVLSLGMVGALSIVRFRTAVKEPLDTAYMFWAIVAGIAAGAGLVSIAIIAVLLIGLAFLLAGLLRGRLRPASAYLLIVRFEGEAAAAVQKTLSALPWHRIKSRSATAAGEEMVLEIRLSDKSQTAFNTLKRLPGVQEVNMVSYNGSTLL